MSLWDQLSNLAQRVSSESTDNVLLHHDDGDARGDAKNPSHSGTASHSNRFDSFAPGRRGNHTKWFVDGCSYFWAISEALEQAKECIWILGWWLSPELYLRRPPSAHEQYRLDKMLLAAAQRGCKINIIIYKEVNQAVTRKYLNPALPNYLHTLLPASTSPKWRSLAQIGLNNAFKSLEMVESAYPLMAPPVPIASAHTKHALENLHCNISVFRHPDHLPSTSMLETSFLPLLSPRKLTASDASKLSEDALSALYGVHKNTVLFWAHHEKLIIIDSSIAFTGGLDLCFGRWDTNQHSIADAHPDNKNRNVWIGQDFNNARKMDFHNISDWQNDYLDRLTNSRMGWSDVSLCLSGPVVDDLRTHFVQRHNLIYDKKYSRRDYTGYDRLPLPIYNEYAEKRGYHHGQGLRGLKEEVKDQFIASMGSFVGEGIKQSHSNSQVCSSGMVHCQVTRSCAEWSHGVRVEHSIANAYIDAIKNSQYFVYIENQFFITATDSSQYPVRNQIGAAIVERVLRAARKRQKFKIIIVIPAIPAFAGNLHSPEAAAIKAVMHFQYRSINRGDGSSIFEQIQRQGYNPSDFIEFYNLRNYDRISTNPVANSNINQGLEDNITGQKQPPYHSDQGSRDLKSGRWDSIAECYMHGGVDVKDVPWTNGYAKELDAYVSEEVYVHGKLMIVDDSTCIIGSANLNDRSQLGDHDSEIAIVVEDHESIECEMHGEPWQASRFCASLRRQIFRKHLGLLKPQVFTEPDMNFHGIAVPNVYDWGTAEDKAVSDPLSLTFGQLLRSTAKTNTEAFETVFRAIPSDKVRNWKDYQQYHEKFFYECSEQNDKLPPYKYGHIVAEDFALGEEGLTQVKDELSTIKGNIVEMPLNFLDDEDMIEEGWTLNALTLELYT